MLARSKFFWIALIFVTLIFFTIVQAEVAKNSVELRCREHGGLQIFEQVDISDIEWDQSQYWVPPSKKPSREFTSEMKASPFYIYDIERKYRLHNHYNKFDGSIMPSQTAAAEWKIVRVSDGRLLASYSEYGYNGNLVSHSLGVFLGGLGGGAGIKTNSVCGREGIYRAPDINPKFPQGKFEPGKYAFKSKVAKRPRVQ